MKNQKAREKIQDALYQLVKSGYQLSDIKVTHLCQIANINRSTFYDNYLDIYDLADRLKEHLMAVSLEFWRNKTDKSLLSLLDHIKKHQKTYHLFFWFNLETELLQNESAITDLINQNVELKSPYQRLFLISGTTAVIKYWLESGCLEPKESINELITNNFKMLD